MTQFKILHGNGHFHLKKKVKEVMPMTPCRGNNLHHRLQIIDHRLQIIVYKSWNLWSKIHDPVRLWTSANSSHIVTVTTKGQIL